MTKEELKQEAEDDVIPLEIARTVKVYNQAYVDKQQKRIAELEKRCANYEMTISKMEKGTCDICKETEKDRKIEELEEVRSRQAELINKDTIRMENQKYQIKKLEQENAELEEKICVLLSCKNCPENKGGYICAKEYENKCLAQKIQYIKELQEENAELNEKLSEQKQYTAFKCNEFVKKKEVYEREHFLLTKANEIIKRYLTIGVGGKITQNYLDVTKEAEQFISEV